MRLLTTRLGGLEARVVDPDGPPDRLVVLCHGFGATGEDLVGLAPELVRQRPSLASARFVFPAAPLELGDMGWGMARAWWMIDLARHAQPTGPSGLAAWHDEIPEGLAPARRMLHAALDEALVQAKLPMSRVVLGGFSQGAMITTDLALRLEEAPAALCGLSGSIVCGPEWRKRAPARAGLRVFQSHGRNDPILSFRAAEALRELLSGAGLAVEFLPFGGEHTIPAEALAPRAAAIGG